MYENFYIDNEHDITICKKSIYIKLLDYNYKIKIKSKCTYLCVDGAGCYKQVVDVTRNYFEDK